MTEGWIRLLIAGVTGFVAWLVGCQAQLDRASDLLFSQHLLIHTMKLKQLKVRPRKLLESSPCVVEMGALFECWATDGIDAKKCTAAAQSLQECMSKPVS